jgi:hypothetical protein
VTNDLEQSLKEALDEFTRTTPLANPLFPRADVDFSVGSDSSHSRWKNGRGLAFVAVAVIVVGALIGLLVQHSPTKPSGSAAPPSTTTASPFGVHSAPVRYVLGLDQHSAVRALDAQGLKVGHIYKVASKEAPGKVISQNPSAGTVLANGSSVSLTVSNGPTALSSNGSTGASGGSTNAPAPQRTPGSTLPPGYTPPTAPTPNEANCASGNLSVNTATNDSPICMRVGSALTVAFDLSGSRPNGSWSVPPNSSDNSVMTNTSAAPSGSVLTATYSAVGAGTTQLSAFFNQTCASGDSTPCTIPPQIPIFLTVTVIVNS